MDIRDARTLSPGAQDALRERVVHALVTQEGLSVSAAARAFGLHRATVRAWWNRYRRLGPPALASKRRGAKRKPLLRPDQEARPLTTLREQAPDALGLGESLWTREAVAAWAARALGVTRTRWVWGRWLNAQGLTPQKPARRAYERDPSAVARWLQEDSPRVEAEAEDAEIHWLDRPGCGATASAAGGTPRRVKPRSSRCRASDSA